ncbi:MAG: WXG100 family type VII secretion target [Actinophytocola sp.]|uniref:WXG100 family type VII secretion target n=1 Tax=Actinophytocola sp. TaxID=1872138 RepID=UPI003D6AB946
MTDTNTAALVVDLQATDEAVRGNGWVSPGLGVPGAPLGLLGSTLNPLSGLAAAGLGWFMPMVSFLGDGLTQLQGGNEASVSSGAQSFGTAGQDIAGVADSYRASTSAQTSEWSGAAAAEYRDAGAAHADGVAGLGQASNTVGSAIIGAGQVVAQAIAEVTELIAEAVAQIVPIMTQAVARAGETFGQSVVEAIPPCVGIAVEYALRIAAKLAALVASGDNLLKLVQGGMAVMELIQQALSGISQQSINADAQAEAGGGAGAEQQAGGTSSAATAAKIEDTKPAAEAGSAASAGSGGGSPSGGSSQASGDFMPAGASGSGSASGSVNTPLDYGTQSAAAVSPLPAAAGTTMPEAPRSLGAGGLSSAAIPTGGMPIGASAGGGPAPSPGARAGAGRGTDTGLGRLEGRPQPTRAPGGGGGPLGGVPLGAMGGGRAAGDEDKEHKRKYRLADEHDEQVVEVAPPVITSSEIRDST